MLRRLCSKSFNLGFISIWTENIQMYKQGFWRGRGTSSKIANIHWIIEKAREFQKTIWFIDYSKAFDCIDHNILWKILKEIEVPDHFTYPEKPVCRSGSNRTGHGTTDWFQGGKGRCQGYTLSPAYLTYIQSTSCRMLGWMDHKMEIRIAGRNINNLRSTDNATLIPESEEELKWLLMKIQRGEWKSWLKTQFSKIQWIQKFMGRTNAEAEAPILWPPGLKCWLTGKDWRQKQKGTSEDEMTRQHHWLNDHVLSNSGR